MSGMNFSDSLESRYMCGGVWEKAGNSKAFSWYMLVLEGMTETQSNGAGILILAV